MLKNFKMKKKYFVEKYKDKSELPKFVRIEACSKCQLNCVECYMRKNSQQVENGQKFGVLKFEDYKKFIDENDIEQVELSNNGEIFLNPELDKIIKYSYEKGINLVANCGVNLNYLPVGMAEILVKYNFKQIIVAIDGATPETYSIYRVNGDFNKVIKNIEEINHYKELYNSHYPKLLWKFIVFGHNEHEISLAKELAKNYNMDIFFETNISTSYSPLKNPERVFEQTGLSAEDSSTKVMLEKYNNKQSDWFYCSLLWDEPQINWDGRILGCCSLFWGDFGGNVFTDGYFHAMNHPKLVYAKNMLTNNAPPAEDIPCSHFYAYKDLSKAKYFMKSPKREAEKQKRLDFFRKIFNC